MSAGELACTYACLALYDDGIPITAEKIATMVKAANVQVESYWPGLFAKMLEKTSIEDLIMNVGLGGGVAAPVAGLATPSGGALVAQEDNKEEKKEELAEESDDDFINSLFD